MKTLQIRLTDDKKGLSLLALSKKRFNHYGFGTFLCNAKPDEIDITQEALDALLNCPEKSGLQGLELWADNRLAWGSLSPEFVVPLDSINRMSGSEKWLEQCTVTPK